MSKYKLVKHKDVTRLEFTAKKGQQISEREAYVINRDGMEGLLKFVVEGKSSSFRLVYDITGYITLKEYLKLPLGRKRFFRVLKNIFDNLKRMEAGHINKQMVTFTPDYVFVDKRTQGIWFVCVPIQSYDADTPLRTFLLSIISCCNFEQEEDIRYREEYVELVNKGINLSMFELEEYIDRMSVAGQGQAEAAASYDGGAQERGTYNPLNNRVQGIGTSLRNGASGENVYLVRMGTGERIDINVTPFMLGRSDGDYIVDNMAVSGRHAQIHISGGRYYVADLGSANGTYVNDERIAQGTECEIVHNGTLRLADEVFVFQTDKRNVR